MARRVFLGLTEVAGYFSGLEAGLRDIGVDARLHDLSANVVGYRREDRPGSGRIRTRLLALGTAPPRSVRRAVWDLLLWMNRAARRVRAVLLLPYALARHDTFVLAGGGMFLDGRELLLLRRLGKKVVVVFTGSDHRPPYLNGIWVRDAQAVGYRGLLRDTARTCARVRRAESHASAVIALAASAQFHTRPFADFLQVGYPFVVPASSVDAGRDRPDSSAVRILHCPTRPVEKGTARIRAAIAALRDRGHAIEYRELTGRPHAEVLQALRWCDFVVDEVYSDSPMAGLATEAANFGRPTVVGGYAAPRHEQRWPDGPPSLFVPPDLLEGAVEKLIVDVSFRHALGAAAKDFVTTNWAPAVVATRVMQLADGRQPSEWMVDPVSIDYIHGWGMDVSLLATGIRGMVTEGGAPSLHLDRRPDLLERLLALEVGG